MKKIFVVSILIFVLLFTFSIHCNAESELGWNNVKSTVNKFMNQADDSKIKYDASNIVNNIASILTTIGTVVVLVGLLTIGVKYMMASPDEAARLKKKLIALVISAIVLLGAYGIWKIIGNILANTTMEVKPMDIVTPTSTPVRTPTPTPEIIQNPEEKTTPFITRCYTAILTREPDESGLNYIKDKVKDGNITAVDIINGFISSSEFKSKNKSNDEIVEALYNAMFNRPSDAEGKANWVGRLNAGESIDDIINAMAESEEFKIVCAESGLEPGWINRQDLGGKFEAKYIDEKTSKVTDYWVYIPENTVVKTYKNMPLIVYLHDSIKTDEIEILKNNYGTFPNYILDKKVTPEAVLIAPFIPKANKYNILSPSTLKGLIDDAINQFKEKGIEIDTNNISITGHGLGGLMAFNAMLTYPGLFNKALLTSPKCTVTEENINSIKTEIKVFFGENERRKKEFRRKSIQG